VRTRFAPSPTGLLHLGHAYAAWKAFTFGPCLLRIEDIDQTRVRPDFTDAIYYDLRWLGFHWPEPVRIQSNHLSEYAAVVETLSARGLTYEDYRTRKGIEDRTRPPTIKLSVDQCINRLRQTTLTYQDGDETVSIDLTSLPDPTIARRDIKTSYHVAVTHDDQVQGITDVVRGRDLADETPIHVLLQTLMGWPTPRYHHHALVMDTPDKKMSKRHGSQTIRSLRENGLSPEAVLDRAETLAR
jgi:glutamyl-Q tRNA(Asp) synthetase